MAAIYSGFLLSRKPPLNPDYPLAHTGRGEQSEPRHRSTRRPVLSGFALLTTTCVSASCALFQPLTKIHAIAPATCPYRRPPLPGGVSSARLKKEAGMKIAEKRLA
jgi:hypothetical protein